MLTRRAVNMGVNKGIDAAADLARMPPPAHPLPDADSLHGTGNADQAAEGRKRLTPEQRQAKRAARRARKAARMAKRASRM
ncbi:hypothetical protein QO034_08305 [Sedimentitalea sp. JM2-8]|uniref:Uncharacterized protein n=1 Tax=Sedimentitalea xiamensis TaxID=3050037 RepID=A0ABT7FDB2_9RHOB|nr:hypothetical protein [Sedimentitalea xiamensis]MDK3073106.1 hypothetical protein [Sedimentitalea xiamensis]